MIHVWADFSALRREGLPLNSKGSLEDLRLQGVKLSEGMRVVVYDDEFEAEATVEMTKGAWFARITGTITRPPDVPGLFDRNVDDDAIRSRLSKLSLEEVTRVCRLFKPISSRIVGLQGDRDRLIDLVVEGRREVLMTYVEDWTKYKPVGE